MSRQHRGSCEQPGADRPGRVRTGLAQWPAGHPRETGGAPASPGAGASQTEGGLCQGLQSPEVRARYSPPHFKPIGRRTAVFCFPSQHLVPLEQVAWPCVGPGGLGLVLQLGGSRAHPFYVARALPFYSFMFALFPRRRGAQRLEAFRGFSQPWEPRATPLSTTAGGDPGLWEGQGSLRPKGAFPPLPSSLPHPLPPRGQKSASPNSVGATCLGLRP